MTISFDPQPSIREVIKRKKYKDFFENIYQEVVQKVEKIGEQEGFDLIIKNEEADLKSNEISDLQFKIGIRTVLYHSDSVDITLDVVDILNASYSKEKENK